MIKYDDKDNIIQLVEFLKSTKHL